MSRNLRSINSDPAGGRVQPSGNVVARLIKPAPSQPSPVPSIWSLIRKGLPSLIGILRRDEVALWRLRNIRNLTRQAWKLQIARWSGVPHFFGTLSVVVFRASGEVLHLGVVSLRVVTTAGVNFIVDAFQNSVELEILKYHGVGTGTNAEASGDTALQTESTTALNPDSTRATGSLTEGASANIYRTVGTVTFDASAAITEHGIFSQAATGGGTLLDRSVFSAINVVSADSIQFTYDLTLTPGS